MVDAAAEEGNGNGRNFEGATSAWFMSEAEICALNVSALKEAILE